MSDYIRNALWGAALVGFIVGAFVGSIGMLIVTEVLSERRAERHAVKAGLAYYSVGPDGEPIFTKKEAQP